MSDHVLAEIARLTGAIAEHKSGASSHSHSSYPTRGRGGRGGSRGRGSYSSTPFHRNSTWVAPGRPSSSSNNSRSGTSTPNNNLDSTTAPIASTSTSAPTPTPAVIVPVPPGGFRNRTLVLNGTGASSTSTPSTPKPAPPPPPPKEAVEVVIGGATFVADPRGNKLVRKTGPSSSTTTPSAPQDSTPKRTSVSGTTYIRTKSGNLVSLDFARQRKESNERKALALKKDRLDRLVGIVKEGQVARDGGMVVGRGRGRGRGRGGSYASRSAPKKSTKLCRFFQKTGQCTRGLTCPYIHDSHKVSLCPLFLRSKCPLRSSTCLLSHSPSPHRSPHCLHFPHCKRGDTCPYAHITVDRDAPVCRAFVEYGWCERGEDCKMRHAVECPEFSERGTCGKVGCKLPHVLRRRNEDEEESEESDDEGELAEGEIEWEARRPGKRARGREEEEDGEEEDGEDGEEYADSWLGGQGQGQGISGAAGRQLSKKARRQAARELDQNEDYVTLSIPLDDDQDDEDDDEDSESVDSADLDDEDSDSAEGEEGAQLDVAVAPDSSVLPTAMAIDATAEANADPDPDESDEDGDEEVEKLLRY
ncbi:hypothetical protein BCR35DRAFT_349148 [Leucosporidium creatinivorum]|uniref:C3H1-type domain-containing protein n=1 Tax=Leucosporidium creatinivorum TaxID=106004 RepID=A0A1Y2G4H7_9BASI|nr:hypothetical protein BCR35DRAFT_349148 [Leucosporidium creatinivorum]